jgi:hypothetical protein
MARLLADSWPTTGRMWAEPATVVSGQIADIYPPLNGPWHGRWPTVSRPLADQGVPVWCGMYPIVGRPLADRCPTVN